MSPIGKYFDDLDSRIKILESGINSINKNISELIDFFNAGPAAFPARAMAPEKAANTAVDTAAANPEKAADTPTGAPAQPAPAQAAGSANDSGEKAEKPAEISAEKKIPLKSKEKENPESRPAGTAEPVAASAAPRVERATSTSNASRPSGESEKSEPAAAPQVERATETRSETPTEKDYETLRVRLMKIIQGKFPGADAIAEEFRERIKAGTLWPVSACTTWAQFDQLKAFLDAKGI